MPKISKPKNIICESHQFGKQSWVQFKEKDHSTSRPLELIHTDFCGPVRTQSPSDEIYSMLLIDDYARMIWFGLLKENFEAFDKFKIFK